MMIDQVFPQIVAEHGTLKEQLFLQAKEQRSSRYSEIVHGAHDISGSKARYRFSE